MHLPVPTAWPLPETGPLGGPVAVPTSPADAELAWLRQNVIKWAAADRDLLRAWLIESTEPERAAEIARRSYWHPNGFAKLVLEVADEWRVRMHVWPAGTDRLGENDPHGHRWNFASVVLCGDGLTTSEYQESDTGVAYVRHTYVGNGQSGLTPTGNIVLGKGDTRTVRSGECHAVDITQVHTVEPAGDDLVATLVMQGAPRVDTTVVYCLPGRQPNQPFTTTTPAEVHDLIWDVLGAG